MATPTASTGSRRRFDSGGRIPQLLGLVVIAGLVLSVLVWQPAGGVTPALVVIGVSAAVFAVWDLPVVRRLRQPVSGVLVAGMIGAFVVVTGGADSPYTPLFGLLLVYVAMTRWTSVVALDVAAALLAAAAPIVYDDPSTDFIQFLVIFLSAMAVVAGTARSLVARGRDQMQQVRSLQTALDQAAVPMAMIDPKSQTFAYVNDSAAQLIGAPVEDILEAPAYGLPLGLDDEALSFLDDPATGPVYRELTFTRPDGNQLILETVTDLVDGSAGPRLLSVGRDVTAQSVARQLESRLSAMIAAVDAGVISVDRAGRIITWNPAAQRLCRYREGEAIGEPLDSLVPDHWRPTLHAMVADVWAGGDAAREGPLRRRDGSTIDVAWRLNPIPGQDGQPVAVAILLIDISERMAFERELSDREQRFRTLAEEVQGMVYRLRLDPGPVLDYLSPATEDITGFPASYFLEDPNRLRERIRPEDHAALDASMSTDPEATSGLATYRFRRQDGSWIWLEDHYTPQRDDDGNVIGSQGIMLDVSARIELEQARQAALDYERQASERLRDTLAQQRQFMQAVSHEVRTPLTTVLGYSRLLKTSGDQLDGDRLEKVVDGLHTQAQRLADLLNDLIDADRLAGSLAEPDLAELDLSALCNQIAANAQLPDHHLTIEVDEALRILGDRDMLQKVVAQLLENAGKHTPGGTQVWLRLRADGDQIVLTVEDDGPGVPEHLVDTMFEPFVQGPQTHELANPGTGIGLALVQRYVAVHRGSVRAEPREPVGTRLVVRLPGLAPAVNGQMGVSVPS